MNVYLPFTGLFGCSYHAGFVILELVCFLAAFMCKQSLQDMEPYAEFGVNDEAIGSAYEEAGGEWTAEKCPDRRGFEAAVFHETKQILMQRINEFLG